MAEKALTKREKMDTVKDLIIRNKDDLTRALSSGVDYDRLMGVFLNSMSRNPKLFDCTTQSLIKSFRDATETGLEPNGIYAHLIPYKDNKKGIVECQYMIDYKGMVELARRSADVKIKATIVYENEPFKVFAGTEDRIEHTQLLTNRGEKVGVYSVAKFPDGSYSFVVLSPEDIAKAKKASKTANFGPWKDWEEPMWQKTAIRRHAKVLPQCPELQKATDKDERIDFGLDTMPTALESKTDAKTSSLTAKLGGDVEDAEFEDVDKVTGEVKEEKKAPAKKAAPKKDKVDDVAGEMGTAVRANVDKAEAKDKETEGYDA